jgi:4-aminobutyrate aminotransferase-like enzyme
MTMDEKVLANKRTIELLNTLPNNEQVTPGNVQINEIKNKYPTHLQYICGKGLLAALIFVDKDGNALSGLCDKVSEKAFQKGLLVVHTGRESIKLAPPLSINEEALIEGIEVLEECIRESI